MAVEPEVATAFLARGILLCTKRLDAKTDEALTRDAIAGLLGSPK